MPTTGIFLFSLKIKDEFEISTQRLNIAQRKIQIALAKGEHYISRFASS